MAARKAMNSMRNLPVKTFLAYEGTINRYLNTVSPRGGINEGAAVYSAPIAKGDLVKIYVHTNQGKEIVEKYAPGEGADVMVGVAVAHPQGIDNVTDTSGGAAAPAVAQMRRVDVALFGLAVIEIEAGGAITPGNRVAMSESAAEVVESTVSSAAVSAPGMWVALGHYHDGDIAAVLLGFAGHQAYD